MGETYWKGYTQGAYHGTDEYGNPIFRDVNIYRCSNCGRQTVIQENYCPSCGKKMRKKV